jgi:hypothetical protein
MAQSLGMEEEDAWWLNAKQNITELTSFKNDGVSDGEDD